MAGGFWSLKAVFQRYRGDGVVSIMSSVSASTESLARIFARGWSNVEVHSLISHPRLDILLQVYHSLGEPDSPPPGLSARWWTFEGGTTFSCDETMSNPKYFAWNQPGTRRQSKPLLKAGSLSWCGPTNRCSQFFNQKNCLRSLCTLEMKVCFFRWIHWVESCYHSRRRWCRSQPGGGRSAPLSLSVTKIPKGDFLLQNKTACGPS